MMTQKIRDFQKSNPKATAKQVADAVGVPAKYVHQIRWLDKKKGRTSVKQTQPAPTTQAVSEKTLDHLRETIMSLRMDISDLQRKNRYLSNVVQYYEQRVWDSIRIQVEDEMRDGKKNGAPI